MKRLISILLLLVISGCGYQVPGRQSALPEGVEDIYISVFVNRTTKPRLEVPLTDSVADVLTRLPDVKLVSDRAEADTLLDGTILSYGTSAISYDQNDKIREYAARMTVEIQMRRVEDGKLLWRERLVRQESYQAKDDKSLQNDLENEAVLEINRRLAEDFQFRLLTDF